jgi:hypothetical protein
MRVLPTTSAPRSSSSSAKLGDSRTRTPCSQRPWPTACVQRSAAIPTIRPAITPPRWSRIKIAAGARCASAGPWSPGSCSAGSSNERRAVHLRADRLDGREAGRRLVFRPVPQPPQQGRVARAVPFGSERRHNDRPAASPGNHRAISTRSMRCNPPSNKASAP